MSNASTSSTSMQLHNWEQVDEICLEFEDQWRQRESPNIQTYAQRLAGEPQRQLVRELLLIDLAYRRRSGQAPTVADYADLSDSLRAVVDEVFSEQTVECVDRQGLMAGAVIGRYAIERELGRGAYGIVYLARDEKLGRPVAIKVPGDGCNASREQVARLVEEARAAARLRHPGIVAIYDVQTLSDGGLFAVLEYVEGRTLRQALATRPSWTQLTQWFADIADALAYAHAQGFVHRDLTPDNVLIDEQDRPHITDFGLAVHDDQQRFWGERAGSLPYMSPEQVRGETHRLDGRSDVWSLGVMLYEAISGRRPFEADSPDDLIFTIQQCSVKPLRQTVPTVPAALEKICLQCLATAPEKRPSSAGDVAHALRKCTQTRHGWWLGVAATAALLLSIIGGLLMWNHNRHRPWATSSASDAGIPVLLDVLVWKERQWNRLATPHLLPLHAGDQLRIEARHETPLYMYLVWIDASGQIAPVYPWREGRWDDRGTEVAQDQLRLPAGGPDQVWTMESAGTGTEILLLLARPTPLPQGLPLSQQLADIDWPVYLRLPAAWRLDTQYLEPVTKDRGPNVGTASTIHDPLLRLQRQLQSLRSTFPVMQALLIPAE